MIRRVQGFLLTCLGAVGLAGCHAGGPSSLGDFLHYVSDLDSITAAVSKATGLPENHILVTGSRNDLHISVDDIRFVEADTAAIERVAATVVAAAEPALASRAELSSIKVIRVGIYHPSTLGQPLREWHLEDVVKFRRGSDLRFVKDVP